jgi:hypothetical protein
MSIINSGLSLWPLRQVWATIAQSAQRLPTDSTVLRSNPEGMRFPAPVQTRPGVHPASCTVGTDSFPWVKRPGLGADHPASTRAEVNIITGFHGLLEDELYLLQVRSPHLIKHHAMTTYRRVEAHSIFRCVRELRNTSISFVTSVRPSVRMEQHCTQWTDFCKISYYKDFRRSVKKIPVLLKSDKNNWHFIWQPAYMYDNISFSSYWHEKCFQQKE